MNALRVSLVVLVVSGAIAGCTGKSERRLTGPARDSMADRSTVAEARWLSGDEEVRTAAARAAKSPLVERAAADVVAGQHAGFLPSGVVAAVGTMTDGSSVRLTILPYQYAADSTHAAYVALIEVNATVQAQTFELIRHRKPDLLERGFERVNSGENGLWIREGFTYVPTSNGIVRRSPERVNWQRFGACFVPLADRLLGEAEAACGEMGNFPGCRIIGAGVALASAAIFCAFLAAK
jgi:hypothetical protein